MLRSTPDRLDALISLREGSAVRARALSDSGREQVQAEAQLLASLEIQQLRAAPALLESQEDGYVREHAAPLPAGRGGRHAGERGSPRTGERVALAQAREDLDALLSALHARGWVLGSPALALREDGSVVVGALDGLRRCRELSAQLADRRWVDEVLQDQDRTLRRHAGSEDRVGPWVEPADDAPAEAARHAAREEATTHRRQALRTEPVPAPTGSAGRAEHPGIAGKPHRREAWRRAGDGVVHALRRVRPLRPGRRGILATAAVLIGALVIGGGVWLLAQRSASAPASAPAAVAPAPAIADPQALAQELASQRHAYLLGEATVPVTTPRSEARAEDDEVRAAYTGLEVLGGEPVVEEAELLDSEEPDAASLRVVTTVPEHQIVDASGEVTEVAAGPPRTSILELVWDGTGWRVTGMSAL